MKVLFDFFVMRCIHPEVAVVVVKIVDLQYFSAKSMTCFTIAMRRQFR